MNEKETFREAMEGHAQGGTLTAVKVQAVGACHCGCGRMEGVQIHTPYGDLRLTDPDDVAWFIEAMSVCAERVWGRGCLGR